MKKILGFIKDAFDLFIACFFIAGYYAIVYFDIARTKFLKFYYTKRGIPFYVGKDKNSEYIVRLDKR